MLILACSRRKRFDEGLLPAIERYDGPAFRVLRRFLRGGSTNTPNVFILSAEYGLIAHNLHIATYDKVMTPARACELRPLVLAEFNRIFKTLLILDRATSEKVCYSYNPTCRRAGFIEEMR
jgi:hypothetical protein